MAAVVALSLVVAGAAGAATIKVPFNYATIQAAINAAANGDTIIVAPGTYHERINFLGKALIVRSSDPKNPTVVAGTVIDGDGAASLAAVVSFRTGETKTSVLRGFTITGGNNTNPGGGIYVRSASPSIEDNVISGNAARNGAGICLEYSRASIVSNVICYNSAQSYGGGLDCAGRAAITGNIIRNNEAQRGGGIWCYGPEPVTVTRNVICNNEADSGGGIGANTAAAINSNTVCRNAALSGGGLDVRSAGVTVTNTIIFGSTEGGGIAVSGSTAPTVRYCDVYGNIGGDYLGMSDPTGTNGNIAEDPLLFSPGAGNYRLKSVGGRSTGSGWVSDTVTSPCLDAGDPASAFTNEPDYNGGRINMGADGNTAYASKTPIPEVVKATPKHVGAINPHPFTALFNVPMHRVSVESNFSISPDKAGTFSWVGKQLTFTPSTPWVSGQWYVVTIAKAARSTTGVRMAAEFMWAFKTATLIGPTTITLAATPTAAGCQIVTTLAAPAAVMTEICNLSGRRVAMLPQRELPQGANTLLWNRRSSSGTLAPAGQYLVRVTARTADGTQAQAVAAVRLD